MIETLAAVLRNNLGHVSLATTSSFVATGRHESMAITTSLQSVPIDSLASAPLSGRLLSVGL
ncbi:hypothetical protein [Variovorax rhizosphaerae]|uniref:Uncharacterized protein n=1 Tax=Variovorax rhizosphaerae TaxID=1836200 RepID=A0ABU8WWR5_9BURK